MYFKPCTQMEIVKLLNSLGNKRVRLDKVPVTIIKAVSHTLARYLCPLFNDSVRTGDFPDIFKSAVVTPIYKSGIKSNVCNYRPISILPTLSKVFEKLMKVRVANYLQACDLLSDTQFGFRANRDTTDAALMFLADAYKSLDNKKTMVTAFLDLSKAFDMIDRDIMLIKLDNIGVRGPILKWFTSYLQNRKQCVAVGGSVSGFRDVTLGVPQGSVLGPLLFTIFINDMKNALSSARLVQFADDSTVYLSGDSFLQVKRQISDELENVCTYLESNKLCLNLKKTSFMIISDRSVGAQPEILLRGIVLDSVDSVKFLGITIDCKLTFSKHIEELCSRLARASGALYKLSSCAQNGVLVAVYYAIFHSILTYGLPCWGGAAHSHVKRLQTIQNRAVKVFTRPTSVMNVASLYKYFCLLKFFKYKSITGSISWFNAGLSEVIPPHSYHTRHNISGKLNIPLHCKKRTEYSFFYNSCDFYNSVPLDISVQSDSSAFKNLLKNHILSLQLSEQRSTIGS